VVRSSDRDWTENPHHKTKESLQALSVNTRSFSGDVPFLGRRNDKSEEFTFFAPEIIRQLTAKGRLTLQHL
jgi:hypothetical protein